MSYMFWLSESIHRLSTGTAKQAITILYRLSTSFVVVKTSLGNIRRPSTTLDQYKPSTAFMVVKTGIPNHYRYSTNFVVHNHLQRFKTGFANIYKPRDFWQLKFCQAFKANLYRLSNGFVAIKMHLWNIYRSSTNSAIAKTCTIIVHRHSTGFTLVKTCITICERHWTGFVEYLQALNQPCSSQNWIIQVL